jgi:hypothetical protein
LEGGVASLDANPQGNAVVPAGYQTLYVLTRGQGLVIQQVAATPSFNVTQTGLYRIHTLIYDPSTLNLGIVVPGVTTGFDVNSLLIQGGGSICASLDVTGAPFLVFGPFICNLFGINAIAIDNNFEEEIPSSLVRLAETDEISTMEITSVYPNPAADVLNVAYLAKSGRTTVSIINMLGQNIYTDSFGDEQGFVQRTLNVSNLESGNYLLRFENNGVVRTTRFNKSK